MLIQKAIKNLYCLEWLDLQYNGGPHEDIEDNSNSTESANEGGSESRESSALSVESEESKDQEEPAISSPPEEDFLSEFNFALSGYREIKDTKPTAKALDKKFEKWMEKIDTIVPEEMRTKEAYEQSWLQLNEEIEEGNLEAVRDLAENIRIRHL